MREVTIAAEEPSPVLCTSESLQSRNAKGSGSCDDDASI